MAKTKSSKRGKRMRTGKGWRLITRRGEELKAALLETVKVGRERIAIFRVVS